MLWRELHRTLLNWLGDATAIVVVTAVATNGFTVSLARRYRRDYAHLVGGGGWPHWRTTPAERARFVTREHRRAHHQAGQFARCGVGLTLVGGG